MKRKNIFLSGINAKCKCHHIFGSHVFRMSGEWLCLGYKLDSKTNAYTSCTCKMFKKIRAKIKKLILFIALFTGIPGQLFALKPFLGLEVGRFNATPELPTSFIAGASAGLEHKGVGIGFHSSYLSQEMKHGLHPNGNINLIPLGLLGTVRAPIAKKQGVFVRFTGIVGQCLTYFSPGPTMRTYDYFHPFEKNTFTFKDDIFMNFGGGIEKQLTNHASIGVLVSYFTYTAQLNQTRLIQKDLLNQDIYSHDSPVNFSSLLVTMQVRFK